MPQAIAAMSLKMTMPPILARFGYRGVLISNTVILVLIVLFATIGAGTPVWLIVSQAFCFGFFTSLQYTSMNTLVYADITEEADQQRQLHREHHAADVDQFRRRDGVADHGFFHSRSLSLQRRMIHGIHQAFLVLERRRCYPPSFSANYKARMVTM